MEIIGAGFGRTGTTSTKAALEILGFGPCYQMQETVRHPSHIRTWRALAAGEMVDWTAFLSGYQATVDWPACEYYRELMDIYPDAKVLLNVRDPDAWYESTAATIYTVTQVVPSWVRRLAPPIDDFVRMNRELIWQGRFGGRFENRAHAIAVFNARIQEVKRAVPADRLLVFDVQEGWEPLCRFLDVPVPDGRPFPHLNEAAQLRMAIHFFRILNWLGPLLAAAGLLAAGMALWRRLVDHR